MRHEDIDTDTDEELNDRSGLPQARLDELNEFAAGFDKNRPPSARDMRWDWTEHFDEAVEGIFMAGNLQRIRQALYEVRYPRLRAEELIPHDTNVNPGLEREVIRTIDVAGEPEVSRDQPDDVPSVELKTGEADVKFFSMTLSYSYSDQDVRKAMLEGMPLPFMKAKKTRDVMARTKDTIAFVGSKKIGSKGLLTATGTTVYATPATGAGGSKKWKDKSADAVLLDLNGPADKIISDTNEMEEPDTWLLPLDAHSHINNRRVGDGTNDTILSFFKRARTDGGATVKIDKTAKSNTGKLTDYGITESRMVVYENAPDKLQFKVPLQFEQKQPQVRGFKVYTYCHMRLGELALWIPASVCVADDVC